MVYFVNDLSMLIVKFLSFYVMPNYKKPGAGSRLDLQDAKRLDPKKGHSRTTVF
jgi:hypothetical protein